jgi:hypothetical protein
MRVGLGGGSGHTWRTHLAGWSPATGLPTPSLAHLARFRGRCCFAASAASRGLFAGACFRALFLSSSGGGDETKSGSTRAGLGRFLSSIALSLAPTRGGRRSEMTLPMQRWEPGAAGCGCICRRRPARELVWNLKWLQGTLDYADLWVHQDARLVRAHAPADGLPSNL